MKKLISSFIILYSINSFAISLQQALEMAYYHSDEIKSSQNNFLNEIEAFPRALASFMPKVSANLNSADRKTKIYHNNTSSTTNKELSRSLDITQPIFNGGGGVASLKSAQYAFKSARGNYYLNEQNIFLNAIKTYLSFYSAKEKYEISQVSLETNVKQLEAVNERLKVGETTITEQASAVAGVAMAESRKLEAYAAYQTAKANFIRMFGAPPTDITLPTEPADLPKNFEELSGKAVANNFSIDALRHATTSSKANEIATTSAILPQVNLNIKSANNNFTSPNNLRGSTKQNALTTTLSINVPILSNGGVEYSDIRRSKNNTRKLAIQLDSKIKEIQSECVRSWENFNAQKSSTKASIEGIAAAQLAYDGLIQEELVGTKTILEVLTALDKLNEAKIRKVESTVQYLISTYELKALVNELTARSLRLNVNYFNPELEFKKTKFKIIGF